MDACAPPAKKVLMSAPLIADYALDAGHDLVQHAASKYHVRVNAPRGERDVSKLLCLDVEGERQQAASGSLEYLPGKLFPVHFRHDVEGSPLVGHSVSGVVVHHCARTDGVWGVTTMAGVIIASAKVPPKARWFLVA